MGIRRPPRDEVGFNPGRCPDTRIEVPDLNPLQSTERLEAMFGTIGVAEAEGVLSVLPEERSEVRRSEVLASRIVTVRTRLHLLGYLRKDNNLAEVDAGMIGPPPIPAGRRSGHRRLGQAAWAGA